MLADIRHISRQDPAIRGLRTAEVLLYPGLWALWSHRLAHWLHRRGVPFVPRAVAQVTRLLTGVEIHPGAVIGRRLFIDHGHGVVIGETARVGDDVTIFHRVTLGSRGGSGPGGPARRHPTIGDGVVLGAGASVLGPVSVGAYARIGAHSVVVRDVPPGARVRAAAAAPEPADALAEGAGI